MKCRAVDETISGLDQGGFRNFTLTGGFVEMMQHGET